MESDIEIRFLKQYLGQFSQKPGFLEKPGFFGFWLDGPRNGGILRFFQLKKPGFWLKHFTETHANANRIPRCF